MSESKMQKKESSSSIKLDSIEVLVAKACDDLKNNRTVVIPSIKNL